MYHQNSIVNSNKNKKVIYPQLYATSSELS